MVRAFGVSLLLAAAQAAQPRVDPGRNGDVATYSTELETGTVHGRVAIDFPATIHPGRRRLFTATLGSGGPKIRAVTTNGSVTVRRE